MASIIPAPQRALERFENRPAPARRIGPFRFLKPLGKGAFAQVWRAQEEYDGEAVQQVAVKLIEVDPRTQEDSAFAEEFWKRIIDEARALRSVDHPNVVRFLRLLIDEDTPDLIGLVMELVEGDSLDKRLEKTKHRGLPIKEVLEVGVAVASALAAAHRAGLVHRDVKPANIVQTHGTFKLVDFGIAAGRNRFGELQRSGIRARIDDLSVQTGERVKLSQLASGKDIGPSGTIGYIDPICMQGKVAAATTASDLYALGATLFECSTGRLPGVKSKEEGGAYWSEVLYGQVAAPRLADVLPDVPAGLAKLVDKLLQPNPKDRPQSAEAVAIALDRLRAELAGHRRDLPARKWGPFRGLGRFHERDRDVFFGRSEDVLTTLELLRVRGLVGIVGASGSGKSSLVRAGVAPLVNDGALGGWFEGWDVRITSPGADARAAIEAEFAEWVPAAPNRSPDELIAALAARVNAKRRGMLFILDQAEELVTVSAEESRLWAAEFLRGLAEPPLPGIRVIMAARRDMIDELFSLRPLAKVLPRSLVQLVPIEGDAWGDVIDQALDAFEHSFESPELRTKVLEEIKRSGASMPLVQFALTELWTRRDVQEKRLTKSGFEAMGGIAGALGQHADATLKRIETRVPHEIIRKVLLAMTTAQGTRIEKSVERLVEETVPLAEVVIDELERARLVVKGDQGMTLAHEALLEQWQTLRHWMNLAREDRLRAADIEENAKQWRKDPDAPLLVRGRLDAAEELIKLGIVPLSAEAQTFVKESRRVTNRDKWSRRGIALLVVAGLAAFGYKYVTNLEENNRALAQAEKRANDERAIAVRQKEVAEQKTKEAETAKRKADDLAAKNAQLGEDYRRNLLGLQDEVKRRKTLKEFEELQNKLTERVNSTKTRAISTPVQPTPGIVEPPD